jgi:hypothetical protein
MRLGIAEVGSLSVDTGGHSSAEGANVVVATEGEIPNCRTILFSSDGVKQIFEACLGERWWNEVNIVIDVASKPIVNVAFDGIVVYAWFLK